MQKIKPVLTSIRTGDYAPLNWRIALPPVNRKERLLLNGVIAGLNLNPNVQNRRKTFEARYCD
jgi:hypothetical protein